MNQLKRLGASALLAALMLVSIVPLQSCTSVQAATSNATIFSELNAIVIPSSANNMTGTSVLTGLTIAMGPRSSVSYHAVWTGTPNGAFSFEFSNDDVANSGSVSNWTALTVPAAFTSGNPVGAAASFGFELVPYSFRWTRIKYTNASSTGTLVVTIDVKP